jgi:hypothetical protein
MSEATKTVTKDDVIGLIAKFKEAGGWWFCPEDYEGDDLGERMEAIESASEGLAVAIYAYSHTHEPKGGLLWSAVVHDGVLYQMQHLADDGSNRPWTKAIPLNEIHDISPPSN